MLLWWSFTTTFSETWLTHSFQHKPSTHLLTRLIGKTTYSQNGNLEITADDLQVFRTLCNESKKFKVATKLFSWWVKWPRSWGLTSGNYFSLASLLVCVCWINWYFFAIFNDFSAFFGGLVLWSRQIWQNYGGLFENPDKSRPNLVMSVRTKVANR